MLDPRNARIAVIGLGYVGLPLAIEFGRLYETLGYDIDAQRVADLREGRDNNHESSAGEIASAAKLRFSADVSDLRDCNVYVVTVPTPVDEHKRPDFTPLLEASRAVGRLLS